MAVLGPSGEPQTLVEMVVTHKPDQAVYAYASVHGIGVAEFWIADVDDLEVLERARDTATEESHSRVPDSQLFGVRRTCVGQHRPVLHPCGISTMLEVRQ